jgi:hypothetical protein
MFKVRTAKRALFAALAGTLAAHSFAPVNAEAAESTGPRMWARMCSMSMKTYYMSLNYASELERDAMWADAAGDSVRATSLRTSAMYEYTYAAEAFMGSYLGNCGWALELELGGGDD